MMTTTIKSELLTILDSIQKQPTIIGSSLPIEKYPAQLISLNNDFKRAIRESTHIDIHMKDKLCSLRGSMGDKITYITELLKEGEDDPIEQVSVVSKKNSWHLFQDRVRGLTHLTPPEVMQLCSALKSVKQMDDWSDKEIMKFTFDWVAAIKYTKLSEENTLKTQKPEEKVVEESTKAEPEKLPVEEKKSQKKKAKETQKPEEKVVEEPTKAEPEKLPVEEKKSQKKKAKETQKPEEKVVEESTKAEPEKLPVEEKKSQKKKAKETQKPEEKVVEEPIKQEISNIEVSNNTAIEETKEPLYERRKKIPKHIKTLVWNKYLGSSIASSKCMCCREAEISIRSFDCGHVVAEAKGGDMTINNLRPICRDCNLAMGTRSMNEFTTEFFGWTV
jgi:hypothetical protein